MSKKRGKRTKTKRVYNIIFGQARAKQAERASRPERIKAAKREARIAALLMQGGIKQPKLSGLTIRAIRMEANKSTFPSKRRVKMWMKKVS